ncbi:hypothetical protein [Pseudomonas sp. BP8]|uniref:hypothetical protein n=1 Tax=Pseudomonas sp. BP8 TaxID=2817864 RepID=UPI001AE1B682|nr:hypothetical protein [Pseudomonas sp. BP8]MBP2262621.1 hypothetical protein [Pseudomonas sp. BP8]HDS1734661.1 hypothetical protein [Pseudomonas putida]
MTSNMQAQASTNPDMPTSPDPEVDPDRPTVPDPDDDPLMNEEKGGDRPLDDENPALDEDLPKE